jgi:hypothetical protein
MKHDLRRSVLQNPHNMFVEDVIADPDLAPQLSDPHRTPAIEIFFKGTFPDRVPDISTPRTDVYITHWVVEDKTEIERMLAR